MNREQFINDVVAMVEEMRKKKNSLTHFGGNGYYNQQGYNQALNDLIKKLI